MSVEFTLREIFGMISKANMGFVCGDPAESFKGLPVYYRVLEDKNPGTMTAIEIDDKDHFLYFFMALGPVIAIDGTFLKGKFRGTLFITSAQDGNDQIYPLAFDRHNSILKGINSIFPEATHGFCTYHISGNLKAKYKMRQHKIDTFLAAYFKAADAYRESEFAKYMDSLKIMHPEAAKYLEDGVGLHRWARARFPSRRYDMQTTNIAKSMNSVLRHARALPIIPLAEFVRSLVQRWFYERRELATARDGYLTEAAQAKLDQQIELSRTMTVHPVSRFEFEVRERENVEVVDIRAKQCSCKYLDIQQLPCSHSLAACQHIRLSHHSLCSHYYTTNA
ncbi:MuDR family transposase [Melia azedarach]|uniref:MuDR family transposase n=1 Tax=Melia azedarach TaxID=155640 RepID=A0ACC1XZP8_MELAZ|nr:MuDR family transposase [Melia azedarach]